MGAELIRCLEQRNFPLSRLKLLASARSAGRQAKFQGRDIARLPVLRKTQCDIVMGTPDVIKAFGAVAAVPKLIVYDRKGRRSQVLYGAPPDLHQQLERAVQKALGAVPQA